MIRHLPWVVALSLAGCAGGQAAFVGDERERLPHDARVLLYDSENDVVIARSRRDEAAVRRVQLKKEIDEVDRRWKLTETRLKKSGGGDRVSLAKKSVAARKTYLDSQVGVAEAGLKTADSEVDAALARLDQTRQRLLVRSGRALAATIDPYDERVKVLEKRAREVERHELDLRTEAQKVFESWKAAEDEYARTTGDFDAGIWID